jgi:predicted small lipoprotein YifL
MEPKKFVLTITVILILSSIMVACGGKQPTGVPPEETNAPLQSPAPTQEGSTQEPVGTPNTGNGVPEDVPIMPDAFEIQVANAKNLTYKVNAKIEDVVAFYQGEFPKFGWDVINNPDSVVGSMAQIARSNAAGDRLVFSIQYNPVGEFTVVQIFITRK